MTQASKLTVGIVGSGRLGTALAKQSLNAGYVVRITNSRGPESLHLITKILLPGAIPSTLVEVGQCDVVILAIPLHQFTSLPKNFAVGKTIIDAMNYWQPTEGNLPGITDAVVTTSELVAEYFDENHIIKTLNHVAYNEINDHALAPGHKNRRAIALAGNDEAAKQQVVQYLSTIGFDSVDFGKLSNGQFFQPNTPIFNARLTAKQLQAFVLS